MTTPFHHPIPLPLLDGDTLLIDNSTLERFSTCARSAEYSIARRLRSTGEKVPLRFGGIVHECLEARYRSSAPLHAQTEEVESVMRAVATHAYSTWQPPEDDFRNFSTCLSLIREYGLAYPFESFEILRLPDGTPFVERPFAIPLGVLDFDPTDSLSMMGVKEPRRIKIIWTGKIDLAYRSSGGVYIMDHKTTSIMGPSYFASFELAHQFYGYVWAAEQLLGEFVLGTVVNALGVRRPTKSGKAFEFERKLIPVDRDLLREWKEDCLHLIADFLEGCRRGYLPKQTAWCNGKYGECEFKKVCTLGTAAQREIMLRSGEFEVNDWSPLKKE